MRIISGKLKGSVIHPPKGLPVRPTTDRAKESLFNILEVNFDLEKTTVLDLFSGTGNIAYECCSRGAERVIAVELNQNCCDFIKLMRKKYAMTQLQVFKRDVYVYLQSIEEKFDLIFADAPYAQKELLQIPDLVFNKGILKEGGWLIIEHETKLDMSDQSGYFDKRVYGQSSFSFFKLAKTEVAI